MKKRLFLSLVLAWVFAASHPMYAEDGATPRLEVKVHDDAGKALSNVPVVIRDKTNLNLSRTRYTNVEGISIFEPGDFSGFQMSGMNDHGEMEIETFNGRVPERQAHLKVQISVKRPGKIEQRHEMTFPVQESVSYNSN